MKQPVEDKGQKMHSSQQFHKSARKHFFKYRVHHVGLAVI